MPINRIYNQGGGEAIASYDYTELAEGTGFVVYYAVEGTAVNMLRSNAVFSNNVVQYGHCVQVGAPAALILDVDYDVSFNFPKIIKGKAIVTITLGCRALAAETNTSYVICKVRKWDGTTETEIANTQSDNFVSDAGAAVTSSKTMCVEITIPQTSFKKGETLRLTILHYGYLASGAGDAYMGFGNDPQDRNDVAGNPYAYQIIEDIHTTKLEFHVPFKLDL